MAWTLSDNIPDLPLDYIRKHCIISRHWMQNISITHKENLTICNSVSKFYFVFIWSSTFFWRNTAHHREPKTALAASGFSYGDGCWTCSWWTLSGTVCCQYSFKLLMMGGVSPETCWASYKYEIKFRHTVASCWIFFMSYTMMHRSTNIKFQ
jgi:hypothetical protein